MADLMSVSVENFVDMAQYLHTPDLYALLRANRTCFVNIIALLYTAIQLRSPDSSKGLSLLKSLTDTGKTYRIEKFKEIHVHGSSPEDTSTVPLGRDGSNFVEDMIQMCLFQSLDVSQDRLHEVEAAYRLLREAFYASTGIGRTLAMLSVLQGHRLQSIQWLVPSQNGSTRAPTPVKMLRAAAHAWVQLKLPVFPELRKMVLFVDWRDTHVPLLQTLKRFVVSGHDDQSLHFELAAVGDYAEDQLEELVLSQVDMLESMTSHLNADHFQGLRTLGMRNFSRQPSINYRPLQALLSAKCVELTKLVWDFDYADFGNPPTPTLQQDQPELHQLVGIKHAKIHSQLLQASLSDMDFSGMGPSLPANLETLVLTGLDLSAYEEEDTPDPFSLEQLCAPLKSLKRIGLRFDFDVTDLSAVGQTLENAQDILEKIVAKAQFMGLQIGIYVLPMAAQQLEEVLHMGEDIQGEHLGEEVRAQ